MDALLIGIIGSLIAALIWQLVGTYSQAIKTPIEFLLIFLRIKHLKIYSSFNAAKKIIEKGVKSSEKIKFFAIRGFPISQETYALRKAILDSFNPHKNNEFKVMLINPDSRFAEIRAEEFSQVGIENEETYLQQIKSSINVVVDMKSKYQNLQLKLHNSPAMFRILIFDDYCLIGFYTKKIIGATSPVLYIKKTSFLYQAFERYFDIMWDEGIEQNTTFTSSTLQLNEIERRNERSE